MFAANWFIDDLMKFINEPYYIALFSAAELLRQSSCGRALAAELFGAAHHRPQELQVIGVNDDIEV